MNEILLVEDNPDDVELTLRAFRKSNFLDALAFLREIMGQTKDVKDQEQRYMDETRASRADFFRRKREVETGEFDEHDAA